MADTIKADYQETTTSPIFPVAPHSGKNIAMFEEHDGYLVRDDAEAALASIAI